MTPILPSLIIGRFINDGTVERSLRNRTIREYVRFIRRKKIDEFFTSFIFFSPRLIILREIDEIAFLVLSLLY